MLDLRKERKTTLNAVIFLVPILKGRECICSTVKGVSVFTMERYHQCLKMGGGGVVI